MLNRFRMTLAVGLSCVMSFGGVSVPAIGEAVDSAADESFVEPQGASAADRITEYVSSLAGVTDEERLASLWEDLSSVAVMAEADEVEASAEDEVVAAVLGHEPSTKSAISRAFVYVASELGFEASLATSEDGEPVVLLTLGDAQYELDATNYPEAGLPWEQDADNAEEPGEDATLADEEAELAAATAEAEKESEAELAGQEAENSSSASTETPATSEGLSAAATSTSDDAQEETVPTVSYKVHVQTHGDQAWCSNGKTAGTNGESKRLEGIWLKVSNTDVSGGIRYRTHVQTYGWQGWKSDGQMSGTSGESKRLEAIQIELTGDLESKYDIYYRVHAQRIGWMNWAKNGESSGTAGMAWRLEAIQVQLVEKNDPAPTISDEHSDLSYLSNPGIQYCSHVQTYGWQDWVSDGADSGTSGESKRLEALKVKLGSDSMSGTVVYKTHVQTYGWVESSSNGEENGTSGESKRLEALMVNLEGDVAEYFDVYYRVHAQTYGWLDWAKNGEEAGTAGLSRRLEALQIRLVPKGTAAPGPTDTPFIDNERVRTIENYLRAALAIAADNAHGYSQENRWGPDYDCSSLVVTSLKAAGLDTGDATYTGNMLSLADHGWTVMNYVSQAQLERGDILLKPFNHTEFYLGDGKNVRAWPASTYYGATTEGDQDGNEIGVVDYHNNNGKGWDYVLRLK